jgi:hypothetical protein
VRLNFWAGASRTRRKSKETVRSAIPIISKLPGSDMWFTTRVKALKSPNASLHILCVFNNLKRSDGS